MSITRAYWVRDMALVADSVDTFDGTHYYTWSGTIPSWFNVEPFYPGSTEHYPTFTFTAPQGTSFAGSWTVNKYTNAGVLVETAFFFVLVNPFNTDVWTLPKGCYTANICWLNPSGGWQSYLFVGKQQLFQDKGKSSSYINSEGEKRYHRKDEVHQGAIITTGNINRDHSAYIKSQFKAIQAFLWTSNQGFVPIIITEDSFKEPKSGEPFAQYDFEFRYAEEDIIQTQ